VNADTRLEDFSIINTGATVDHDCRIGYASHIAPQCALAGHVEVGSKTFLGVGCKIIPNVKIGDAVIVGAGSLVIRDIPTGVKAYGTPATIAQ
jgi:UDP-perosamine 4-acetyltransferase